VTKKSEEKVAKKSEEKITKKGEEKKCKKCKRMKKVKQMVRVKMLCSWQTSRQLCDEWKNMCEEGYRWKDIEITWEDENIDFYVIINFPRKGEFFIKEKTVIFQMEPSVAIRCWGEWANPEGFFFMGSHKNCLNAVQLQIRTIPTNFKENREDKLVSILSAKAHDIGHIKRLNFVKELEKRGKNVIHVFGRENYHNFTNYQGKVDNKEDCFSLYKYCFQAENNSEYNYATEKIWEPIVCECLCFYFGCPNLEDYIDSRAFVRLDLDDIDGSLSIIETAIKEDWWSQRVDFIRQEKRKIIEELGFFPRLKKILSS
jgi:hypothetical protein